MWKWLRKRPEQPEIPAYKPVSILDPPAKKKPEEAIVVEEHDTSAMTSTGVHRAWKRLTTGKKD